MASAPGSPACRLRVLGRIAPVEPLLERGAVDRESGRGKGGIREGQIQTAARVLCAAFGCKLDPRRAEPAALPDGIDDPALDLQAAIGQIETCGGLAADHGLLRHHREVARGPCLVECQRCCARHVALEASIRCNPAGAGKTAIVDGGLEGQALADRVQLRREGQVQRAEVGLELEAGIAQHRLIHVGYGQRSRLVRLIRGLDAGQMQAPVAPGGAHDQALDLDPLEPAVEQIRQAPGHAKAPRLLIRLAEHDAFDLEIAPVEAQALEIEVVERRKAQPDAQRRLREPRQRRDQRRREAEHRRQGDQE